MWDVSKMGHLGLWWDCFQWRLHATFMIEESFWLVRSHLSGWQSHFEINAENHLLTLLHLFFAFFAQQFTWKHKCADCAKWWCCSSIALFNWTQICCMLKCFALVCFLSNNKKQALTQTMPITPSSSRHRGLATCWQLLINETTWVGHAISESTFSFSDSIRDLVWVTHKLWHTISLWFCRKDNLTCTSWS